MNRTKRAIFRIATKLAPDVKRNYRRVRRLQEVNLPVIGPNYSGFDLTMTTGGRRIGMRVFEPRGEALARALEAGPEGRGIVVFVHGGGWVLGTLESYSALCDEIANLTGRVVLSIDYGLAPEHPFPSALVDCWLVARRIQQLAPLLGLDRNDILMMGDSAGGNLIAALALYGRETGLLRVRRQILLYPALSGDYGPDSRFPSMHENGDNWLLTRERIELFLSLYAPEPRDRLNPLAAPLNAASLADMPDSLVITAEFDPLRDEGEAYALRLAAEGNRVNAVRILDAVHGFMNTPISRAEAAAAWCIILGWLGLELPESIDREGGDRRCRLIVDSEGRFDDEAEAAETAQADEAGRAEQAEA